MSRSFSKGKRIFFKSIFKTITPGKLKFTEEKQINSANVNYK